MLFGPSAGGQFVDGWTAKQFDSALPIECCAADLVFTLSKILRTPLTLWRLFRSILQ